MSLSDCARCWDTPCTCPGSVHAAGQVLQRHGFTFRDAEQSTAEVARLEMLLSNVEALRKENAALRNVVEVADRFRDLLSREYAAARAELTKLDVEPSAQAAKETKP